MSMMTMCRTTRLFKYSGAISNEPSHISKLPPELLAIIFEIGALLSYQNGTELTRTSTFPLIISSVCCIWRNIALNVTRVMWSTIVIDTCCTLDIPLLYLGRSGDVLLDITIRASLIHPTIKNPAGFTNSFNLTLQYSHRWRYLKLDHCYLPASFILRSVRAPYLTKLIMNCSHDDYVSPMFIDGGVPMLSDVSLYGIAKFYVHPTRFLSVQKLRLTKCGHDMDNAEFSSFLESFPSLRRLILESSGPQTVMTDGQKPATLLNIVELTTISDDSGLGFLTLNLQAPLLRVVNLSVLNTGYWDFFWKSFGLYPNSLPSVEKLTISGTLRIFQGFSSVFPNVQDLSIDRPPFIRSVMVSENMGFEQARYWPSLEKLTVLGWIGEYDDKFVVGFVKGMVEWYGHRIQITTDFFPVRLKEALEELGYH